MGYLLRGSEWELSHFKNGRKKDALRCCKSRSVVFEYRHGGYRIRAFTVEFFATSFYGHL